MSIIVIESIGFCATHSISEMLIMDGKNSVSHGTQNFKSGAEIGPESLPFTQFYAQMLEQSSNYDNCISVHSNFCCDQISQIIARSDTKFFGLMRKSQRKQILSCFYWIANAFLNGREEFTQAFLETVNRDRELLDACGLPININTCFMLVAFSKVVNFNISLLQNTHKIFFMEDVIANPTSFANSIGATDNSKKKLKVNQGPSHKSRVTEYDFLSNAEEILEILLNKLTVQVGQNNFYINNVEQMFFEKSKQLI